MAICSRFKGLIKKAVLGTRILPLAERLVGSGAAILMYHSIVEDPDRTLNTIGISQSRNDFEAHIRTLAQRFAPVTIEQVTQFAQGRASLPRRAVAVTFDDGFADNYDCALPVLMRYGVPAAFYIMVNAVDTGALPWYCRLNYAFRTASKLEWTDPELGQSYKIGTSQGREVAFRRACEIGAKKVRSLQDDFVRGVESSLEVQPSASGVMLTWEQVRALKQAGHIIGGHTLSHPNLAHVSQEEARSEVLGCKRRLEKAIGEAVDHFSYPHPALNPQWTRQTLQITREAGFKSAVLTTCGLVRRGDEPLALKRIYAANDLQQWTWNLGCTFLGRQI
jgi:peptidoglycan/xylan/chitin deacetylase (PgdA/CDA1 family)